MHIGLISPSYFPDPTGTADCSKFLAHSIRDQSAAAQVSVLAKRRKGQSEGVGSSDLVPVHRLTECCDWEGLKNLIGFIRVHKPDIIHIEYQESDFEHHPMVLTLPRAIKRIVPTMRVFARLHDLTIPSGIPKWQRLAASYLSPMRRLGPKSTGFRLLARMLKALDGIVVCKVQDEEHLRRNAFPFLKPEFQPPIRMIPIGSNIPVVPILRHEAVELRRVLGWTEQNIVMVYFGFVQETKGAGELLECFDRVAQRYPQTRLLILGAIPFWNPEFGKRYQSLINQMKHAHDVVWKQYLSRAEISAWLQTSDFAFLPFRGGAVLNRGTLIACIDHGLPVLTTKGRIPMGGPFVDGQNILLARDGDLNDMQHQLERLIEYLHLRNRLSAGAKHAASYFEWTKIGREHLDFYGGT